MCQILRTDVNIYSKTKIGNEARACGFGVNAWTAETEAEIDALRERGIDGAVIDDCHLAAACRGGRTREPHRDSEQ